MTPREHEALTVISAHIAEKGYPPTYEALREVLGVKSKNGIHRLVHSLARQGYVEISHKRRQSIELGRFPPTAAVQGVSCPHCGGALAITLQQRSEAA